MSGKPASPQMTALPAPMVFPESTLQGTSAAGAAVAGVDAASSRATAVENIPLRFPMRVPPRTTLSLQPALADQLLHSLGQRRRGGGQPPSYHLQRLARV